MNKDFYDTLKSALYDLAREDALRDAAGAELEELRSGRTKEKESAERSERISAYLSAARRGAVLKRILIAAVVAASLALTACGVKYASDWFNITENGGDSIFGSEDSGIGEIKGYYLPTAIPESYSKYFSNVDMICHIQAYVNNEDIQQKIYFTQIPITDGWSSIKTEGAEHGETTVEGIRVYYVKKEESWFVIWRNEHYKFTFTCPASFEWSEVAELILSVKPASPNNGQANPDE